MNYDLGSAQEATIRIGPTLEGDDEEQTTVGAGGSHVWAGNKDSETVTQLEPLTRATIHGVARGGLAVVADATVWAAIPPATATLPRIDPATNRVVARIPLRTRAVDGLVVAHGLVWAAVPASQ